MALSEDRPIIIVRRKRRGGHGAHHSGAWKVAYADFVTAMMAFFLLLWLLNVTTDEQRDGIADYFDPQNISPANSGSGGVLGGRTVSSPGQLTSPNSPFSLQRALPGRLEPADSNTLDNGAQDDPSDGDGQAAKARREQAQFEAVEEELRQAIQAVPDLKELAQNLIIDQTEEGLRIQLVDQDRRSMFPIGSAAMYDETRKLLALVAEAVDKLPQKLSIAGHTDATPYVSGTTYGNWELSSDRANASRRALVDAGIAPGRIATVVGKADTDNLFPDNPRDSRNRRISITLLRQAPVLKGGGFDEIASP